MAQYDLDRKIPRKKISEIDENDLEEHYKQIEKENNIDAYSDNQRNALQPGAEDPRLWLIKTKIGTISIRVIK